MAIVGGYQVRGKSWAVSGGTVAGVVTLDDLSSRGLEPELASRVTRAALPEYFFHARGG